MKKLLLILLITGFSHTAYSAMINDVGGHSSATMKAVQEDIKTAQEKIETVKNAQITQLILGGPQAWMSAGIGYLKLGATKVTDTVVEALSGEDEEGQAKKTVDGNLPEGEDMIKTRDEKLQASSDPEKAGTENTAETKKNRKVAITEMATYGYALGLTNRVTASRAIGDDVTSAQTSAVAKTNSATNYGAAVAASTSTANSNTQVFNNLLKATAARNVLRGLTATEQNNATNLMINDPSIMFSGVSNLLQ